MLRSIVVALDFDPQATFFQKFFQPALGDQSQLPFLDALRVRSDFGGVYTPHERHSSSQQSHQLPIAAHGVAIYRG
ncbi:hypothetical protein EV281_1088 [Rhizobium sp. BK418]|nr:hypothetical protein EV281_1088 [Rhizobium sp. BK418]